MNILSLFDGMSCGQLALQRAGIAYDTYYASEIDKHATKVTQLHFPDTQQIGDITKIDPVTLPQIDLVIGGSPCQSFSQAGKKEGFNGSSSLFWEYVRLLKAVKPTYFLLENVVMKKEWEDIITAALGVKPILINSALLSAQNRPRLYWTNIPNVTQPLDIGAKWSDISEDGWFAGAMRGRRLNENGKRDDYNQQIPIVQYIESRQDNKTNCLSTVGKDNIASSTLEIRTPQTEVHWRYFTRRELERLQTLPDGYTDVVSLSQASKMIGNGWTVDVIAHILKGLK